MHAKFGWRPFPRLSVILFTERKNDHITSALLMRLTMRSTDKPFAKRCTERDDVKLSRSWCGRNSTALLTLSTWAAASSRHQWLMSSTDINTLDGHVKHTANMRRMRQTRRRQKLLKRLVNKQLLRLHAADRSCWNDWSASSFWGTSKTTICFQTFSASLDGNGRS